MTNSVIAVSNGSNRAARDRLEHVTDEALHAEVKALAGRHNVLMADLLAHLAAVEARGIHRERACSSLYTYCLYELGFSEDEAQRRARAARAAREFPVLFEMLAEGAIHLTGLLLLAPYLTAENHAGLLARARFRTKREIMSVIAEIAPRPDAPARIELLGSHSATSATLWQAFMASLRGPVRELVPGAGVGEAPPAVFDDSTRLENDGASEDSAVPRRIDSHEAPSDSTPLGSLRYRVEFTVSEEYVRLLEEARNLLQHQVPDRDIARVHEMAMAAFVAQMRKRRQGATRFPRPDGSAPARVNAGDDGRSAPARIARGRTPPAERRFDSGARAVRHEFSTASRRYVPAAIRRTTWRRDEGRCTFTDSNGRRCKEQTGLEIHHEHAFALGGTTTVENLRLLCRAHNGFLAERDFGREFVQGFKER